LDEVFENVKQAKEKTCWRRMIIRSSEENERAQIYTAIEKTKLAVNIIFPALKIFLGSIRLFYIYKGHISKF
jgi:hypothetical protein